MRSPVRSKTVVDNKIIEKLNSLGKLICYEKDVDMNNKRNDYLKITGITNNIFRQQKH
jgi:hypothetical protein